MASAQISLALCLFALGRDAEAEPLMQRGRGTLIAKLGTADPRVVDAGKDLAAVLKSRSRER